MSDAEQIAQDEMFNPVSMLDLALDDSGQTGDSNTTGQPKAAPPAPEDIQDDNASQNVNNDETAAPDNSSAPAVAEPGTDPDANTDASTDSTPATAAAVTPVGIRARIEALKSDDIHRYRRVRALGLVGVVAGVAGVAIYWILSNGVPGAAPDLADQAQTTAAANTARNEKPDVARAVATDDQAAAAAYYRRHGTYTGLTLDGKDVRVAGGEATVAISREIGGVCWMYGVIGDEPTDTAADPTGVACTDEEMATTQQQMLADEAANAELISAAAADAFARAAGIASNYSVGVFSHGQPSLNGLSGTLIDGVTVTANHSTWLEAQFNSGSACFATVIGADGTVGDITTC